MTRRWFHSFPGPYGDLLENQRTLLRCTCGRKARTPLFLQGQSLVHIAPWFRKELAAGEPVVWTVYPRRGRVEPRFKFFTDLLA